MNKSIEKANLLLHQKGNSKHIQYLFIKAKAMTNLEHVHFRKCLLKTIIFKKWQKIIKTFISQKICNLPHYERCRNSFVNTVNARNDWWWRTENHSINPIKYTVGQFTAMTGYAHINLLNIDILKTYIIYYVDKMLNSFTVQQTKKETNKMQ